MKSKDIFVYDRYRSEFMAAGYHKIVPSDIRWGGLSPEDSDQFQVDFPTHRNDPVGGYDPDAFVWMDLIPYGDDPKDDRKYRSHLGKLVTKVVNKIIGLPVLKDHGSGGVTGALKNMSHGSVNNVARSHSTNFTNVCNQFIPQVASHPLIRSKYVLQIMDGTCASTRGPVLLGRGEVHLGIQRPAHVRPTRSHSTTWSGTLSTPSALRRSCPRRFSGQARRRPVQTRRI